MKTIRIILLILIILGIIALITQKKWVPKLVNKILLSENSYQTIPVAQKNFLFEDGRQCYSFNHEATKTEPYTVNEFLDITINKTKVSGTKSGTQKGPDMTNGYTGTIEGTISGNKITSIFSYVIEGSNNKESEIYKGRTDKIGLEKLRYPLIEKGGMLIPDTTKNFKILLYSRVTCTGSN